MTVAAILHGYCRRFFKVKSAHGSQTGNKSFQLHGIQKNMKQLLRRTFL